MNISNVSKRLLSLLIVVIMLFGTVGYFPGTLGCMRLYNGGVHDYVVRRVSYEALSDTFNDYIVPRESFERS